MNTTTQIDWRDPIAVASELRARAGQFDESAWHVDVEHAAARCIDDLRAQSAALRAERDQARARFDRLVQVLVGIHALLPPKPVETPDSSTMVFVDPDANQTLHWLRARIDAIPQAIDDARNAAGVPQGGW